MQLLMSILVVSPVETTIQLIKNIKSLEPKSKILIHVNIDEDYEKFVNKVLDEVPESGDWLFFNPNQIPTKWGYITQALLSNMKYAYENLIFDYYLVLPFNCLMIKGGITGYIEKFPADMYCQFLRKTRRNPWLITRFYNKITTGKSKTRFCASRWFRKSIYAKHILKPYTVEGYLYESNHEGLCFKKKVLRCFADMCDEKVFKSLSKPTFFELKIKVNRMLKNHIVYPHIAEEVVFASVVKKLAHTGRYSMHLSQFCFLNMKMIDRPAYFEIKERMKKKPETFFYKWVSTDPSDENRLKILKSINEEYSIS